MRTAAGVIVVAGVALLAVADSRPDGSGGRQPVLLVEPTMNGDPPGLTPDPAPGRDACLNPRGWPIVWDRMDLFGQAYQFFAAWSDAELSQCFVNLRHAGKRLVVAAGAIKPHCTTAGACWGGVAPTLRRMKALGAEIAYLEIDEPLTTGGQPVFGHAVRETARFIHLARQELPGAGVILQEAYPHQDASTLRAFVGAVDREAEALTGLGIQYVQLDHDWRRGGTGTDVAGIQDAVRSHGVGFGVIFWRADPSLSWEDALMKQGTLYRRYRRDGVFPDMYAVINWTGSPEVTVPEWPVGGRPTFLQAVRAFVTEHVPGVGAGTAIR